MLSRFLVAARPLFPEPGTALLAVSGGPDSVALLDLMTTGAAELQLSVALAHVDHGIAPDSAAVAERVRTLAEQYGVPAHLSSLSLGHKASETRARQERYRVLRHVQKQHAARYLVTAHHADDQIETVLYRFLKGSGPAGLAGIRPRGAAGLVRPLLNFRRSELSAWLEQRSAELNRPIQIWSDPANRDVRHDRVWMRQDLLPRLRERFGPGLDRRLVEGQTHAASEREAWSELLRALPELAFLISDGVAEVAWAPLRTYHKALSEALLRAVVREAGGVLGHSRAARVLAVLDENPRSGATLDLGQGWVAEIAFDRLRIFPRSPQSADHETEVWGVNDRGATRWDRWEFQWRTERAEQATRAGLTTWVTVAPGTIRPVRRGDRIRPLGGTGHRLVHRVLMEAKVPRSERERYPVLVRDNEIVWLPGVCRASVALPEPGAAAFRIDASAG